MAAQLAALGLVGAAATGAACIDTAYTGPDAAPMLRDASRTPDASNAYPCPAAPAAAGIGLVAFDGEDAVDLDFCSSDGITIEDDLSIEGPTFKAIFASSDGNAAIPYLRSLFVEGEELLFTNDAGACALEDQSGVAFFPGWNTTTNATNAGSVLTILGGGPGFIDVHATWGATLACNAGGGDSNGAASLYGSSTWRVFVDGRIVRLDAVSLDGADGMSHNFSCDLTSTCAKFPDPVSTALTSYYAFGSDQFSHVGYSVLGGAPAVEPLDGTIDAPQLHPMYDPEPGVEAGYVCAADQDTGRYVGMTWRTSMPYAALGEGGRVSEFTDPSGLGAVAFEFDFFFDPTGGGVPARNTNAGQGEASAYRATTMLFAGTEELGGMCTNVADAVAQLDTPPSFFNLVDVGMLPLGFDDSFAEYYWSQPEGVRARATLIADDRVPAGAMFAVEFEPQHTDRPRVYLDNDAFAAGSPPEELVEGTDFLTSAGHGGPLGLDTSITFGVYMLRELAPDQVLFIDGSGEVDAPTDLDL